MRLGWGALACLATACAAPAPAPDPIDGTELCDRFEAALLEGVVACCGAADVAAEIDTLVDRCDRSLAPLVDDPSVGVDSAAALVLLDELEARLGRCDASWLVWANGPTGTRTLFAGTRAIGTDCRPTVLDPAVVVSCIDSHCPVREGGVGALFVCAPYVLEGGACALTFECTPGLFCTAEGTATLGACVRPRALGGTCTNAAECATGYCAAGVCATPSAMRPESICAPLIAPPMDRAIDLVLTGLPTSPTREVTLRVLDETDAQVALVRLIGVGEASSSHHVPRAIPERAGLTAQIWTFDASSPLPEMRSWELPILAEGAVELTIDFADPTAAISRMPSPTLDALFDVQTFNFDPELGRTFYLRLVDDETRRTVAQARLDAIPAPMFTVHLPDAVTPGRRYEMILYVDVNDDGSYQPPPIDHSWHAFATAPGSGGLSLPYSWSSAYQDVFF